MPDEQPSVSEVVGQKIAQSNPEVFNRVVQHLAEKELARRTDAIVASYTNLDKLEVQLNKIKPQPMRYDVAGTAIDIGFTPEKFNERKKLQKQIDALRAAINKALSGDFAELDKFNKGGDAQQKEQKETEQ